MTINSFREDSRNNAQGSPLEGILRNNKGVDVTKPELTSEQQHIFNLIKRNPTEEILTEERLANYISSKTPLRHYIGFEISGFVHLGTGLLSMNKVADFQQAGAETTIFLADYHSWINKKLGGDLETIQRAAGTYFKEAMKMSLECVGGKSGDVKFVLGSDLYKKLGLDYLNGIIKTSMEMSLARAKRSITVLGRREGDEVDLAQLLYVPMQVADIYGQKVNLAHAGMDQRKAHAVALDVSKEFQYSPVAVHHHLLMGIHITEEQRQRIVSAKANKDREAFEQEVIDIKMSKSNPSSAIFIHDSEEQIKKKIMGAFCPVGETEVNPIIDISRYVIWPYLTRKEEEFEVTNAKTKETSLYKSQENLEAAYKSSLIHPLDMKGSVSKYLVEILGPARKHFLEGPGKRYLDEMNEIKITK
jgi:tyrosyl-tRNA synthetase